MCVKVIASQRWDVFLRHGVYTVIYHVAVCAFTVSVLSFICYFIVCTFM